MFCSQCGEKNPEGASFCTKCGAALVAKAAPAAAPAPAPAQAATGERTSGMAVAALIMGLVGLLFFGPVAVLAIIFGGIGISQANKDPYLKGKGMAVAGLVLGIIGIAGWIIAFIVWSSAFWWLF